MVINHWRVIHNTEKDGKKYQSTSLKRAYKRIR